jgi:hypothetical protein
MQKETFHNEALQAIDMLLCPIVEGLPVQLPPISAAIAPATWLGPMPTALVGARWGACLHD